MWSKYTRFKANTLPFLTPQSDIARVDEHVLGSTWECVVGSAHMSHPKILAILQECTIHSMGCIDVRPQVGNRSNETCGKHQGYYGHRTVHIHAISLFRKHLNDQLLVLIPPSPHVLIRVDNFPDKIGNILLLSTLVMERYAVGWQCQGLKGSSDINFRSTCDIKMQLQKVQCYQLLYKVQHLTT